MKHSTCIMVFIAFFFFQLGLLNYTMAQDQEYTELNQALAFPDKVTRLNLSGMSMESLPQEISLFKNLTYLNLRNNHLKILPEELSKLKNLKVLDVGENEFVSVPQSMSALESLEELFIDNEQNLDFESSIDVIAAMPRLRVLHLENNRAFSSNSALLKLQKVNALFVTKSMLRYVPKEVSLMDNLRLIDFENAPLNKNNTRLHPISYGVKIR